MSKCHSFIVSAHVREGYSTVVHFYPENNCVHVHFSSLAQLAGPASRNLQKCCLMVLYI